MKYRFISGCVIVTGPPRAICSRNSGITDSADPSTFPNRTATFRVANRCPSSCTTSSATRFVAPITDEGRTALSVEIRLNDSAPHSPATSPSVCEPSTLFFTASVASVSISVPTGPRPAPPAAP